jgi:CRP-like cAMP-binding protein
LANIQSMEFPVLSKLAFFEGLSEDDLALFAACFRTQWLSAGTVIFEQGASAEYLYLVVRGEVAIHFKPDDAPPMLVTRVQPGGVFGWSAATGNQTYTSGAVCVQDSQVLQIRGTSLRTLCAEHPEAGKIILDRLAAVIAERQKVRHKIASILNNSIQQS